MTCKNCNNKQEEKNEYGNLVDYCAIDGHEVRTSIESCDKDTSNKR